MVIPGKCYDEAISFAIGENIKLTEYETRKATGCRSISINEVKGYVIAKLDILSGHYKI